MDTFLEKYELPKLIQETENMNGCIYCCRANHPTPYNLKQRVFIIAQKSTGQRGHPLVLARLTHLSLVSGRLGGVSADGGCTLLTHVPGPLAVGWYSVASVVTIELTSIGSHPPAGEAGLAPWWWQV